MEQAVNILSFTIRAPMLSAIISPSTGHFEVQFFFIFFTLFILYSICFCHKIYWLECSLLNGLFRWRKVKNTELCVWFSFGKGVEIRLEAYFFHTTAVSPSNAVFVFWRDRAVRSAGLVWVQMYITTSVHVIWKIYTNSSGWALSLADISIQNTITGLMPCLRG